MKEGIYVEDHTLKRSESGDKEKEMGRKDTTGKGLKKRDDKRYAEKIVLEGVEDTSVCISSQQLSFACTSQCQSVGAYMHMRIYAYMHIFICTLKEENHLYSSGSYRMTNIFIFCDIGVVMLKICSSIDNIVTREHV